MILGLFLLLVVDSSLVRKEACDMIELHHMHDAEGRPLFEQIILWDWNEQDSNYHVRAWHILQGNELLQKNYKSNQWYISWHENKTRRCFVSRSFKESWRQTDPERDDKRNYPECKRIGLRK